MINSIICADVLDGLKKIDDNVVTLTCSSPPYNVDASKWEYASAQDDQPYKDYIKWLSDVFAEVYRVTRKGGRLAINIDAMTNRQDDKDQEYIRDIRTDLANILKPMGWKFYGEHVWCKSSTSIEGSQFCGKKTAWGSYCSPSLPAVRRNHEYIVVYSKEQFKLEKTPDSQSADITQSEFQSFIASLWLIQPENRGLGNHPCCLTSDTECLTDQGWKSYQELKVGDKVAAFDLETRKCLWDTIKEVFVYDYDGTIMSVDGRSLSMAMTPNHRCVTQHRTSKTRKDIVKTTVASDLSVIHSIVCSASWEETIGKVFKNVDYAELLGWFIAEGHYGWYSKTKAKHSAIHISQSYTHNSDYCHRIENLLNKNGWKHSVTKHERKHSYDSTKSSVIWSFNIHDRKLIEKISQDVGVNKNVPNDILAWNKKSIQRFFESMMMGDGCKKILNGTLRFTQKSKATVDWMQAIAFRLGYDSNVNWGSNNVGKVTFTKKNHKLLRDSNTFLLKEKTYKGIVWCISTSKTTFVARRKNSVFITGNSFPEELPYRCIKLYSYPNDLILDPFNGVGTTTYIADRTGRRYIGIDMDEAYCAYARKRIETNRGDSFFGETVENKKSRRQLEEARQQEKLKSDIY